MSLTADPGPDLSQHFDGGTYDSALDHTRLSTQLGRVFAAMQDREWHTLAGLSRTTGDPENSIATRLDDLRKPRFGAYEVFSRRVEGGGGQWEYLLGEKGQARRRPRRDYKGLAECLAEALELVDPNNPVLLAYRGVVPK